MIGANSGEAATFMKYYMLSHKFNKFLLSSFSRDYYLYPELMAGLNEEARWDELMLMLMLMLMLGGMS